MGAAFNVHAFDQGEANILMSEDTKQSTLSNAQNLVSARGQEVPLISVVVVTYYTGVRLDACLASILAQDIAVELIVVDNGNPAGITASLLEMERMNPDVHVLTGHGNIGFAKACNKGARQARGDILLLLNPDCDVPAGAVRQLMDEGQHCKGAWMVGPRLINQDGSEQRGARRYFLTPRSALVEGLGLYRLAPGHPLMARFNQNNECLPSETIPIPIISGACMMLPTTAYWAVGGMDENYFLHVEDVDFCFRFHENGGTAYFVPHVSIKHFQGTSAASSLVVEWHKTKGFWRYFWKNFRSDSSLLLLITVSGAVLVLFLGRAVMAPFRK